MIPATAYHLALALETAAERTMPLKPRPKLKGISIGGSFKATDKGKIEPTINRKLSTSQKIAAKKNPKKKWRAAK